MREPVIPELDAETYLLWESRQRDRHELHHGFVVAFAGGTLDHDRIALNLRNLFDAAFPAPCRSFGSDVRVRADTATFFYADAGVVCEETPGAATEISAPRIIAEVLSPSTRAYDLIDKRAAYRKIGSLEGYVVVHTAYRRIELDVRTPGGWSTWVSDAEPIPLGAGGLAFADVYARTSVDASV